MQGTPPTPRNASEHTEAESGHGGDLGTVMTVDPVRRTASLLGGRDDDKRNLPWWGPVGPDGDGWFGTPAPGWKAVVGRRMGTDAIEGYAAGPTLFKGDSPEKDDYADEVSTYLSLTGTLKVYRAFEGTDKNFRSHFPGDLLAGDQGFRTAEGAMVYAGRGGIAGIKVTDLCQILLSQVDDLVRLVSRNFEVMSDWGEIQTVNEGGKTRLVMKGNATAKETYAGTYSFTASIGDGDAFIDIALTGAGGQVWSMRVDPKGNQHLVAAGDKIEQVQGHHALAVTKDQKTIIGGTQEVEVDGGYTLKSPHVHLGDAGGQPAPLGNALTAYLKSLVSFLNNEMTLAVISPGMPTKPGAVYPCPDVPDFLSAVVDYV